MKKGLWMLGMTMLLAGAMVSTAFAGQWNLEEQGWRYKQADGTSPISRWQWIDGDEDGVAEYYYFNEAGYCLLDTVAPNGYQVDKNGAWMQNGVPVVMTQEEIIVDMGLYTIPLPKSWDGHFQIEQSESRMVTSIYYAPIRTYPELIFYIAAYPTEQEAKEVLGYEDRATDLGKHGEYYYLGGRPTDTALEFYTEEDWRMVQAMGKDYHEIMLKIRFKGSLQNPNR